MTHAVLLDQVVKRFSPGWGRPPRVAVDRISLEVPMGQAFGFVGPNGAGKSTTIKILIGALKANSGSAQLFGRDVDDHRARVGMGFVPENPSLHDYLTPLEVLRMGLALHGVNVEAPDRHCMAWLERFGLADVARVRIRQFSKGMTQRTALAHAMAIQPRLLILDEPLSGLDPIGRRDVVDILAEYKRTGGTIFLTSHVLHDVERLADVFGLIHKGRLRAVQTPWELVGGRERVVVRTIGHARPGDFMHDDGSERWFCDVPRSDLWRVLDTLKSAGHEIVEIKPALNLETAFLAVVGSDDAANGEGS
jgi:ABC-2 type transport system ATP-binding protein